MKKTNGEKPEKKTGEQTTEVELKKLQLNRAMIGLQGVSPLIMHAWSHKAKQQMLDKQMKKATTGRMAKDPEQDYRDSMYLDAAGAPVFPSIAFKAAAVNAAIAMDFKKTNLRQSFHVEGEMIQVLGGVPSMREDMVRIAMGTADIRYRAEFKTWGVLLPVVINSKMLSLEQLVNLFEVAGFGIGVGEWRPEKDGQYGRFKIADGEELKALQKLHKERNP